MKISYSYPEMMLAILVFHCVKVMKDNDTSQIKVHPADQLRWRELEKKQNINYKMDESHLFENVIYYIRAVTMVSIIFKNHLSTFDLFSLDIQ